MGTKPDAPEPEPPATEPVPAGPCSDLPAKELERMALELLDGGETEEAREKLNCALELNPDAYQATQLLEQLDADPVAYLGKRNFKYTVQSSETLSKIAQSYLGSSLKFVILARYNGIEVPSNLAAGQVIKIPGKKPAEVQPPPPEVVVAPPPPPAPVQTGAAQMRDQALELEAAGRLREAYELMSEAVAEDPSLENGEADLDRIRLALVVNLEEQAYDNELSGDLQNAVETWQSILEIDANNIPAQINLNRLKRLTE
jgi:tetratricopeptide (TPR) repeat protein